MKKGKQRLDRLLALHSEYQSEYIETKTNSLELIKKLRKARKERFEKAYNTFVKLLDESSNSGKENK